MTENATFGQEDPGPVNEGVKQRVPQGSSLMETPKNVSFEMHHPHFASSEQQQD